jgi:hypothetical protein
MKVPEEAFGGVGDQPAVNTPELYSGARKFVELEAVSPTYRIDAMAM